MSAVEVFYLTTYIVKVEQVKEEQFRREQAMLKAKRGGR